MKKNESSQNKKRVDWKTLAHELAQEMSEEKNNLESQNQFEISETDFQQLNKIKEKLNRSIFKEVNRTIKKQESKPKRSIQKIKEIILNLEILPFQYATRSNSVQEIGRPWRHDGAEVKFKLQMPHDKMEIYSPAGEFLRSFPVSPDGEVVIHDLEAGIYYLYLRGRKITDLEFGEKI